MTQSPRLDTVVADVGSINVWLREPANLNKSATMTRNRPVFIEPAVDYNESMMSRRNGQESKRE